MSKFHSYSLNNQILIAIQRPEATICASYSGWKSQGRQVKAGERGIKIICPAPYKKEKIKDVIDPKTGKPELLADGNALHFLTVLRSYLHLSPEYTILF